NTKKTKKQILHYPQLNTMLMVENFIKKYPAEFKKRNLWEHLPKKMMYQTFCVVFDYLLESNKITVDEQGKICWGQSPEQQTPTSATEQTETIPPLTTLPPSAQDNSPTTSPPPAQYSSSKKPLQLSPEIQSLLNKFHPLEKKVISVLFDGISLKGITSQTNLKEVEAMRAVQWLENKKLVTIITEAKETITPDINGLKYLQQGLPEKRFLLELPIPKTLKEIENQAGLTREEINVSMGILKQFGAITINKKVSITPQGKNLLNTELPQETFLKHLPLNPSKLTKEQQEVYDKLKQRKNIIKTEITKEKIIHMTQRGKQLKTSIKSGLLPDTIGTLTPEIIISGQWKKQKFREYDIKINVPKINAGKFHPYTQFLWQVRKKLLAMGFEEMEGPVIETEFFNFDALYQPQNHPARDWSDTYKIKSPRSGSLPDEKVVNAVKQAHEKGWKYKWSEVIAKQLMPRSQDTAISPRHLAEGVKIPGKYFSIVRCYRPDVIDATHGVEFSQMGGFVIAEDLNFRHLLGLLIQFASQITGAREFRFKPAYFPFTEPSVEISAKHPKFGWLELAGAGIFRPEMTEPLGYKQQILAWGFGIDRLAMLKLGIKDIRDIFTQDINKLRRTGIGEH
ncbi:MAG: phenylalanine--tRNA ligase subunit alpha, partial [Nanoarchaeota archaeon]|nr:phenylalanine--tRNA ligase subunit alpha [Nanoarchaeota archaeon]